MMRNRDEIYVPKGIDEMRFVITSIQAVHIQGCFPGDSFMVQVNAEGVDSGWNEDAQTVLVDPYQTRRFGYKEEASFSRYREFDVSPTASRIKSYISFEVPMDRADDFRAAEYVWVRQPPEAEQSQPPGARA